MNDGKRSPSHRGINHGYALVRIIGYKFYGLYQWLSFDSEFHLKTSIVRTVATIVVMNDKVNKRWHFVLPNKPNRRRNFNNTISNTNFGVGFVYLHVYPLRLRNLNHVIFLMIYLLNKNM